jgi:hypothetical protein
VKCVWLPTVLASVASIVTEVNSSVNVVICCMYPSNIVAFAALRVVEVKLTSLIDSEFNQLSAVHCIYSNSMCVVRLATHCVLLTFGNWNVIE